VKTPKCTPEYTNTRKISVALQVVPDFHNTIAEIMFMNATSNERITQSTTDRSVKV